MSAFEDIIQSYESLPRVSADTLRVKANRWFTPEQVEEDGNVFFFNARRVMSRLGNRAIKHQLGIDSSSVLAIPADLQGVYYKSTVGLLLVEDQVTPTVVRLETLGADGSLGIGIVTVQHALIDSRINRKGQEQIRFR